MNFLTGPGTLCCCRALFGGCYLFLDCSVGPEGLILAWGGGALNRTGPGIQSWLVPMGMFTKAIVHLRKKMDSGSQKKGNRTMMQVPSWTSHRKDWCLCWGCMPLSRESCSLPQNAPQKWDTLPPTSAQNGEPLLGLSVKRGAVSLTVCIPTRLGSGPARLFSVSCDSKLAIQRSDCTCVNPSISQTLNRLEFPLALNDCFIQSV